MKNLKNQWLLEIRVREAVESVNELLKTFLGTATDSWHWGMFLQSVLPGYGQEIEQVILWRYTYDFALDGHGRVTALKLVRMSWFI